MKFADVLKEEKRASVIAALKKYNYTNVHDKSYDELMKILTNFRAQRINHSHPSNEWF